MNDRLTMTGSLVPQEAPKSERVWVSYVARFSQSAHCACNCADANEGCLLFHLSSVYLATLHKRRNEAYHQKMMHPQHKSSQGDYTFKEVWSVAA